MANAMPNTPYPIKSYNDLLIAVQEWADRDDEEFLNQIPNFIDFAQKQIFRAKRWEFTAKEAYLQVTDGMTNLPTDWLTTNYILFGNGYKKARETSLDEVLDANKQGNTINTAPEVVYCRLQNRLMFAPAFNAELPVTNPDGSVSYDPNTVVMGYWFDPNRPSEGGQSPVDYLIQIAPDVLLYTTMTYASTFIQDSDAETAYTNKAQAAISAMDEQNKLMDNTGVKVVKMANIREYW